MSANPNNMEQSRPPEAERTPPAGAYPPPYWYPPSAYREDGINLSDLWNAVISNKWLVVALTSLCTAAAVAYAIMATPIYRAETLLAPVEKESPNGIAALAGQFGTLADLAGISMPGGGDVDTALATLTSRDFVTRFIREEQLKPALFPGRWDADTRTWIPSDPSPLDWIRGLVGLNPVEQRESLLAPGEPTDWGAYDLFIDHVLDVSLEPKSGLVTVAIEWEQPRLAAAWANQLVERLNAELRQKDVFRAQKSIEYLRQQIDETSLADLRSVLFRLIEEHTKTMTLAKVNEEYVFDVIDPALAPERPVRPRRMLMAAAGFLLGCAICFVVVVLKARRA